MKGCLANQADLDPEWNLYIGESFQTLLLRLDPAALLFPIIWVPCFHASALATAVAIGLVFLKVIYLSLYPVPVNMIAQEKLDGILYGIYFERILVVKGQG